MTFAGEYLCQIINDFTKRSEKPISIEPPHWEICQKACTGKTLSMDCVWTDQHALSRCCEPYRVLIKITIRTCISAQEHNSLFILRNIHV